VRAELPHVLNAYQKLHDKGFEIVGISLDQGETFGDLHGDVGQVQDHRQARRHAHQVFHREGGARQQMRNVGVERAHVPTRATNSRIEPSSSATNSGPCVGIVPSVTGTRFLAASEPAIASAATIGQKRATNIAMPVATL
jgi:hypothetical protein